jgi:hypothetical protein
MTEKAPAGNWQKTTAAAREDTSKTKNLTIPEVAGGTQVSLKILLYFSHPFISIVKKKLIGNIFHGRD